MVEKAPDAFRNISEVASVLGVPAHVLRFWETRFNQIKPLKRSGGRRYYRPDDIVLLQRIRQLLYDEGYTIKGAQQVLKDKASPKPAEAAPGSAPKQADADASRALALLREADARLARLQAR